MKVEDLKIKIFADGADAATIKALSVNPLIKGFTTNPTLMKKAGIKDYELFAKQVLNTIGNRPISFEVFADNFDTMERQARKIASWGENVYVKIPITNTKGFSSLNLVRRLSQDGIKVNVTAITHPEQVFNSFDALKGGPPSYISIFAGRIADTGRDPLSLIDAAVKDVYFSAIEVIWASPRELLNVIQADHVGCHIITVTEDILKKLPLIGKDLKEYSLETVQMFYNDAQASGYTL